jgi:hypothetical protein
MIIDTFRFTIRLLVFRHSSMPHIRLATTPPSFLRGEYYDTDASIYATEPSFCFEDTNIMPLLIIVRDIRQNIVNITSFFHITSSYYLIYHHITHSFTYEYADVICQFSCFLIPSGLSEILLFHWHYVFLPVISRIDSSLLFHVFFR